MLVAMNNQKNKSKKTISFIKIIKSIKHLGLNFTKKIQYLYIENYKT